MIEHFSVNRPGSGGRTLMIAEQEPGALDPGNPENASGEVARTMATKHVAIAKAAGKDELFIAADRRGEGDAAVSSRHGFTDLGLLAQLGAAVAKNGSGEPPTQITSREMSRRSQHDARHGLDIFTRDFGTRACSAHAHRPDS